MPRITLDVTPAVRTDPSGIAYYILELLPELLRLAPEHQFTLGIRPEKYKKREILQQRGLNNFRYRRLVAPYFQIFTGPIDIFHSTGSLRVLGPQGSVLRVPRGLHRKIITLHDLIPMEGWYVPNTERWVAKRTKLIRETLSRVDGVITVSHFIKKRILDTFDFPEDRIQPVWHGVNHERFRPSDPEKIKIACAKLKIDRPYLISFSAMYPRKNTAGLVRAFARSRASRDGLLLLGGNTRGEVYEKVLSEVASLKLTDRVRFLGYVEHDDVPLLYSGSRASLFPSFYEGFGFPVLEAMACGTPIATANVTSMPEIAGDCAEYFDPADDESMAAAINNVWDNESQRIQLISRGLERAKLFTWERAARETLAFYKNILGRGRL